MQYCHNSCSTAEVPVSLAHGTLIRASGVYVGWLTVPSAKAGTGTKNPILPCHRRCSHPCHTHNTLRNHCESCNPKPTHKHMCVKVPYKRGTLVTGNLNGAGTEKTGVRKTAGAALDNASAGQRQARQTRHTTTSKSQMSRARTCRTARGQHIQQLHAAKHSTGHGPMILGRKLSGIQCTCAVQSTAEAREVWVAASRCSRGTFGRKTHRVRGKAQPCAADCQGGSSGRRLKLYTCIP